MEITQFTYFQQCGGLDLKPVSVELTYGLERLAMYLQGVDNVYDLEWVDGVKYGDVFHQNEVEQSRYNFELADTELLFSLFDQFEAEAARLVAEDVVLPAYDVRAQMLARVQFAGRTRCHQRDRADEIYRPSAAAGPRLRGGVRRATRAARLSAAEAGGGVVVSVDLLVEIGTEELPARFVDGALEQMRDVAVKAAGRAAAEL